MCKIHGCTEQNLPFDGNSLVADARESSDEKEWTELANHNGVTGGNRGQIVYQKQRKQRKFIGRAKLKLPGCEIRFPTHLTISSQKTELQRKIESGDILIGDILPPETLTKHSVDKHTRTIVETRITIQGRKMSLNYITKKVFNCHDKLGLLRITEIAQVPQLTTQ